MFWPETRSPCVPRSERGGHKSETADLSEHGGPQVPCCAEVEAGKQSHNGPPCRPLERPRNTAAETFSKAVPSRRNVVRQLGVTRVRLVSPPIDVPGDWLLKPTRVASRYDGTCTLGTGSDPVRAQKLLRAPIAPQFKHNKKNKNKNNKKKTKKTEDEEDESYEEKKEDDDEE